MANQKFEVNGVELANQDTVEAYQNLLDEGKSEDAMIAYVSNVRPSDRDEDYINNFSEAFAGEYGSEAEFAKDTCQELYSDQLSSMSPMFASAIDWEKVWDSTLRHDYWYHGKHYFRNI